MPSRAPSELAPATLALASGAFFALAAPPFDVYPALWLGLGGLAHALTVPPVNRRRAVLASGLRGLAFGFAANVIGFRFVALTIERFTDLPKPAAWAAVVLLAAAQGLAWAVCGIAHDVLASRGVPRWAAFAIGAYAATFVPQVFPWTPAGAASPWPAVVQLADTIGERGVTALLALAAALAAQGARALATPATRRSGARSLAAGALLTLLGAAYGAWRIARVDAARADATTYRVALVQPAIAATERWEAARAPGIVDVLTSLTRGAEARGVDLTIWPESAYPYPLAHGKRVAPPGLRAVFQRGIRGPVLTGVLAIGPEGQAYNSAAVVTGDGQVSETYDKRHLLWFGEKVPLAEEVPWIRRVFSRGGGLTPGARDVALTSGPARMAVLNCFEDTLPAAGREAAEVAPNLLVNVTNDAWFAGTAESELHLRLAAMRAIELRRDMVRAVNLGETSWIDAAGRVRARYDAPFAGTLDARPALLEGGPTIYARAGDAPWVVALAVALVVHAARRRRSAGA